MNRKKLNFLICFSILLFLYELFEHSNLIYQVIYESSKIWFYNLLPTIFPIYIIVDLLLNYNALDYLSKFFGKFMLYFFKMQPNCSFVFLLSLISGFPSNSKYLKSLLDDKIINVNEANKLLLFTHFSNPLFIITTIGLLFLQNKKVGLLILICHYLTNFLIGFIVRNTYVNLHSLEQKNKASKSFITCLSESIYNTIKILFLLYGIITFFMILTAIIKTNLHLNSFVSSILCGLLEMTQGLYYLKDLAIPLALKASLMTFFISFGGLSIHMQVFSILSNYKLKYSNYFLARICHALIASSLVYLFLA